MIHRPGQTCQVGFNVSSTLQEHSISVLTKCRAKLWIQVVPRKTFSPWANKPRAFFTIFRYQGQKVVRACTIRLLNLGSAKHEKGTKYLLPLTSFNLSHQTRHPALSRISAAPFCPTLYWPIHSSEIYLFCVHLQESCISWCLEICVVQKNLTVWAQRVWDFSERF